MTTNATSAKTFVLTLGTAACLIVGLLLLVNRDPGLAECLSSTAVAQECSARGGCSGIASPAAVRACGSSNAIVVEQD